VARAEGVVFGFIPAEKSGQAVHLLYRVELVAPSGQDLMSVSLMADVPNKAVARGVKDVMHRNRELNGTQAGTCMAADTRTGVDNELADLVGDLLQVFDT